MAYLEFEFDSKTLKRQVSFKAIIPYENFEGPYPTLYLLHGLGGSSSRWLHATNIRALQNGCYGDFGAYIGEELVQVTRQMFPLSTRREDTWISGMSMGGFGAYRNGLKYCDTFGKVAIFAGAVHFYEYDREWVRSLGNTRGEVMNFEPLDETENTDRNPRWLIGQIEKQNQQDGTNHFPAFYITCGVDDALLGANESLARALKEAGADVIYQPRPGGHTAIFCNENLPDVFAFLNPQTKARDRGKEKPKGRTAMKTDTFSGRIERCGETFPRLFDHPPVTNQGKDPEFMRIMQRYIFGEVWHVGFLSDRMRALCEVVAMTAMHTLPALKNHIRSAFNAGCSALDIREAVYQCSPFTGFPHVMEAQVVMNEVFAEKGIEVPLPSAETIKEDESRLETGKVLLAELFTEETMEQLFSDYRFLPEPYDEWLPYALTAYGMADFGSRGVLSVKERELLSVVILAAVGDTGSLLKLHTKAALALGNTPEEMVCALVQASPYMGLPRLLGAVSLIKDQLQEAADSRQQPGTDDSKTN